MSELTRRHAIGSIAALWTAAASHDAWAVFKQEPPRLALFRADVTPPVGHPLLGNRFGPAKSVDDPLFAHGFVLTGFGMPIVLAAIDWCEIRNEAYQRWRTALAEAAATTVERVLFSSVHQHDAPLADLEAQRLLEEAQVKEKTLDVDYFAHTVQKVADAVREARKNSRPVSHLGIGQAKVEQIASNRRVVDAQGKIWFGRFSTTRDASLRDLPEGLIDPWLKTLSFWDGEQPLAALSAYATHPMSHYGRGAISSDFVGLARARRQQDDPKIHQIYVSGCSGDVTAGKYNDGATENRERLTTRLYEAMVKAWKATVRFPLNKAECRSTRMVLAHRESPGWTEADLREQLADASKPLFARAQAAMGLSSRRNKDGHPIDLQVLDLGPAQIVLFPGESFVAYQLMAQQLRPDSFVLSVGYGECSPGYIPTESAFREGFADEHGWCWVAPGAEQTIAAALKKIIGD